MNDHVTKPIDPDRLFETLIKWIPHKNRGVAASQPSIPEEKEARLLPESLPGINLAIALKHVSHNQKLLRKLLMEFLADYQDVVSKIRSALQDDLPGVQRITHTLKGVAGSLGAVSLQSTALTLEMAVTEGRTAEFEALLSRLAFDLDPLLRGLRALGEEETTASVASEESACWPVDPKEAVRLAFLFDELHGFLKSGHSKSREKLGEIRQTLQGNAKTPLSQIENQIEGYEYEQAIEILKDTAQQLGISIKG
ncbi:MAG: Hpt domain-containing protein [Magnetococcales bacterium]|nr:Hpt domain-containing protein [Magnetococcales bacterium]